MIYDSADIELLRFAAAAKNIPPDLQYRLSSRVWDREHIHTLCAQKLLAENRNHLSISLTLKGATLLNHLGWPVTLDAKQPARNKLERRLQSAWTAALFYRAGFGIFNNKASDLAMPETYLPANALRRDTTVATTRVFAGVRYMGIAHSAERMLLAHYVDGGHMYITSEMRMFNTMAVALCALVVCTGPTAGRTRQNQAGVCGIFHGGGSAAVSCRTRTALDATTGAADVDGGRACHGITAL